MWEMGLLGQSDWGDARLIDYPGRTENHPLPMFARHFDLDVAPGRRGAALRIGNRVHEATVNGEELTDEVSRRVTGTSSSRRSTGPTT